MREIAFGFGLSAAFVNRHAACSPGENLAAVPAGFGGATLAEHRARGPLGAPSQNRREMGEKRQGIAPTTGVRAKCDLCCDGPGEGLLGQGISRGYLQRAVQDSFHIADVHVRKGPAYACFRAYFLHDRLGPAFCRLIFLVLEEFFDALGSL